MASFLVVLLSHAHLQRNTQPTASLACKFPHSHYVVSIVYLHYVFAPGVGMHLNYTGFSRAEGQKRKEQSYISRVNIPCFCLALKNQATLKQEQGNSTPRISSGEEVPQNTSQQTSQSASHYILPLISFSIAVRWQGLPTWENLAYSRERLRSPLFGQFSRNGCYFLIIYLPLAASFCLLELRVIRANIKI